MKFAPSLRQVRAMKIEWEYDLVEKPFCEQLKTMGWEWIKGDPDLPESTFRHLRCPTALPQCQPRHDQSCYESLAQGRKIESDRSWPRRSMGAHREGKEVIPH